MALLTLADLKTALGVTGAAEDDRLQALLTGAESWVKAYCQRDFERKSYVEFYSGTATHWLPLRQRPVKTVSEVRENLRGYYGQGATWLTSQDAVLTAGDDYALALDNDSAGWSESGLLFRVNRAWPVVDRTTVTGKLVAETGPAPGNVRVSYVAGYDVSQPVGHPEALPPAIGMAIAAIVGFWRRTLGYGGLVTKEKLGRWEVEVSPLLARIGFGGLPDQVYALLMPFREATF